MNLHRIHLIIVFLLVSGIVAEGQESAKAVLIDSFEKPGCELLLNRLDYLASETSKSPGSTGFVVIHPGDNVFENAAYERAIRNNSTFRNFPPGLIRPIWKERKKEFYFEMWTGADSTPPLVAEAPFGFKMSNISTRTRFVENSVEVYKLDGKLNYGLGDCVNGFSLHILSKVLLANPELSAEILVFNKQSSGARKLIRLLAKSALSEHKMPQKRLRIIYGGSGIAKEWSSKISAVEIWLLPTKRK